MSKSTRRNLQLIGGALTCVFLAYTAGVGAYALWHEVQQLRGPRPIGVFWEAWDRVEDHFYGELPSRRERTYGAIRASLGTLNDAYTVFVEPPRRELERDQLRGHYGGIGVTLRRNADGQIVLSPRPASPADFAGIREGDILLAVDGRAVTSETSLDEIRARFHGEAGSALTLTLSRPPTPQFDLTITRDEIQVPSVVWRTLDQAPNIGYVRIKDFTERTDSEVVSALEAAHQVEAASLVLDLRDSSGGRIDSAVAVASQFIGDGVLLYQLGRDGERAFKARGDGSATEIPLAVLVNGRSASAAEIVAAALQDHGRAPLIGEPTFGKGSIQLIYTLSDGSSLHLTSAIWLTPDRRQVQARGLTPDIHVCLTDGPQDEQLDRAVGYLESFTTHGTNGTN